MSDSYGAVAYGAIVGNAAALASKLCLHRERGAERRERNRYHASSNCKLRIADGSQSFLRFGETGKNNRPQRYTIRNHGRAAGGVRANSPTASIDPTSTLFRTHLRSCLSKLLSIKLIRISRRKAVRQHRRLSGLWRVWRTGKCINPQAKSQPIILLSGSRRDMSVKL